MLRDFPGVHRWEETDDVLQNAQLRLNRALGAAQPPTVAELFRLAAAQVRRELIDLARHYSAACGLGANLASPEQSTAEGFEGFETLSSGTGHTHIYSSGSTKSVSSITRLLRLRLLRAWVRRPLRARLPARRDSCCCQPSIIRGRFNSIPLLSALRRTATHPSVLPVPR
jgi:hypothetical protein